MIDAMPLSDETASAKWVRLSMEPSVRFAIEAMVEQFQNHSA